MTTNVSNSSSNSSYNKLMVAAHLPASECILWLAVLVPECLAIVILNVITIIVFVKQPQLQRRSTYLIIHLATVDILVGAVSGPLQIAITFPRFCDLWNYNLDKSWLSYMKFALLHLFSFTSLVNLVVISLERLHATFFPFKHRFIKKWIYGVIMTVMWLTTTARESVQILLNEKGIPTIYIESTLYLPFYLMPGFLICACYILIVVKVRCSRHPYHHGAASLRERKLTGTSLIVALVSLLCYLPVMTHAFLVIIVSYRGDFFLGISLRSYFHIGMTVLLTFLANSIVNPAIYALRIPGFRAGVSQIFCRTSIRAIRPELPLRNLGPA